MESSNKVTPDIALPKIIFGTSILGNLYTVLSDESKRDLVREYINQANGKAVFDTAGKYGAGLALESLGKCLRELDVKPGSVIISNKLGWFRTPLTTPEPLFEKGIWRNLQFDSVQKISYDGILECFKQGNELLNGYSPQWVSVHDPDEYLQQARNCEEEKKLYEDILGAYRALADLKASGRVSAIGVGAKNWRTIQKITRDVNLDWVMFANSFTIIHHPPELLTFIKELNQKKTTIFNSAVFHSGFLTGGEYFDYKIVKADTKANNDLLVWRESFFEVCKEFGVRPADACLQFALSPDGISGIAVSTADVRQIGQNFASLNMIIPDSFWIRMRSLNLLHLDYPGFESR